jgi:predicted AlkP superfamily phosphohydrolase/phosphomutase
MVVVYDGVDKLQHLCWRFLDPDLLPTEPNPWESQIRRLCLDYFRHLDTLIQELVTLAGREVRVFMASDHGFGATNEIFYANVWLEQEGYLSWTDQAPEDDTGKISGDRIKSHVVGIDWTKTMAYALTPSSNGIYIRRSSGPDRPGISESEYIGFRNHLAEKLLAFKHPDTGQQILKRVLTREEAFPGSASQRAPDLTLVLEDYGFLSVLNSNSVVKPRLEPAGTHRPNGVFMAAGPGIAGPRSLNAMPIINVAPTLLHSLGLPVPADIEGRVATECYDANFIRGHPILYDEPTFSPDLLTGQSDHEKEDADQDRVLAGLRALGYIE